MFDEVFSDVLFLQTVSDKNLVVSTTLATDYLQTLNSMSAGTNLDKGN